MTKLSNTQIISAWIITLNSIAINAIVILNSIRENKSVEFTREKSQMEKLLEESIVKVAIYKDTAYWVLNNVIYKAKIDEDGNILNDEAEEIDVFKLSDREVENLLTILDSIKK